MGAAPSGAMERRKSRRVRRSRGISFFGRVRLVTQFNNADCHNGKKREKNNASSRLQLHEAVLMCVLSSFPYRSAFWAAHVGEKP